MPAVKGAKKIEAAEKPLRFFTLMFFCSDTMLFVLGHAFLAVNDVDDEAGNHCYERA